MKDITAVTCPIPDANTGRPVRAVVERFGSIFARDSERRYRAARGSNCERDCRIGVGGQVAPKMSDAGMPIEQVADQLGHKDLRMLQKHYRHRIRSTIGGGTVLEQSLNTVTQR
jgi:hypothetical protein